MSVGLGLCLPVTMTTDHGLTRGIEVLMGVVGGKVVDVVVSGCAKKVHMYYSMLLLW